jgi:hypothetical protein
MSRRLPAPHRFLLIVLLSLALGLLPGCVLLRRSENTVSFQFAAPEGWHVVNVDDSGNVTRLDTDGDGDRDWVILYSFDDPGNAAFAPVRCAIYQSVQREPRLPIIYPYHLQAPGWTYLGEGAGRVSVRMADVVTGIQPDETYPEGSEFASNEVVVENKSPTDQVTRVSIFQWRNTVPPEYRSRADPQEYIFVPSKPPPANSQWYQCIGLFEGTVEVRVETNQVTVADRMNDRSQLARVNVYKPVAGTGGYLYSGQDLVPPVSSCVDFAFGLPPDVAQSPYPEKIVLAFHKQFQSADSNHGAAYLTESARQMRDSDPAWRLFSMGRGSAVERVCLKRLGYGSELEAEVLSFSPPLGDQATPEIPAPITTQVETWAEYHIAGQPMEPTRILWQLAKQDNQWKIQGILATESPYETP